MNGSGKVRSIRPNDGCEGQPDLGDLVIVLLAGTLAGLRDRLIHDGFGRASDLVADLVDVTDDYLTNVSS